MSNVRIYACGGTGIGIGRKVADMKVVKGAAIPKVVYLDTSDSDMLTGFEKEDCYVLSNVNGAGKLQGEHVKPIRKVVPEIIKEHEPADLNIIISSASGGTGAVYATELAEALILDGKPTVVSLVVTREDSRATQNSIQTLKRLNRLADKKAVPVVVNLVLQENASDEEKSDNKAMTAISALLIISSGLNVGLDTRDVANFLYFDRVTPVKPRVLELAYAMGDIDVNAQSDDVITLLELTPQGQAPSNIEALYRATGESSGERRIIAYTHPGSIGEMVDNLELHKLRIDERLEKVNRPALDLSDDDDEDLFS